jgi:ATP-dependent 26S proteasome regulatory subunit
MTISQTQHAPSPALPELDPSQLANALKKPKPPTATTQTAVQWPSFLSKANQEYKSGNAHVFVLHGNVNDYQDNQGLLASLRKLMMASYDDNYTAELSKKEGLVVDVHDAAQRGTQKAEKGGALKRICAYFVANEGLKFASNESFKTFSDILTKEYDADIKANKLPPTFLTPSSFEGVLFTLSKWFDATKKRIELNRAARMQGTTPVVEAQLTMMFFDCDVFFPAGNIGSMNGDRLPITYMRNWALDKEIGNRNRLFLITRHLTQVHESLRGGFSGSSTILIPKPPLEDRLEFSENFCRNLANRCARMKLAGEPLKINDKEITGVEFAEGFDHRGVAIQSSGMSRNQIEKAFNDALNRGIPVDDRQIRTIKQKCMEEEFDGVIEFVHPSHGFSEVGGHEELKTYILENIAAPLRSGDSRTCSPGVLMTGPGGTGKTFIALATAAEAGVNFVELKLSKLMNRYIGGTEEMTQRMLEAVWAASPCIALIDEIESALGGGRVTTVDGNTAGRMFNSIMTFLSDESRLGKIVVMAATNRPELLDPALIRAGRFGAILPVLPPPRGGDASITGRLNILNALASKHRIKFAKDLQGTMLDPQVGLGRLLRDEGQIWTGAEIETVLKDAIGLALRAKRDKTVITLADWELAMDSIIPNTGDVERMTDLALLFANNVRYCPEVWRARMKDKGALINVLKGGTDYRAAA